MYSLSKSLDEFEIKKVFICSLLKALWNCPEAMYHILKNSDTYIIKTNLAPLIVSNFYCNYLSGNYMENSILYIITLMLKDEIDKMNSVDDVEHFLDNTKCGYLLEELQKMPDIQLFFKKVIFKTVEKIERNFSFREINLSIGEKKKELIKLKAIDEKILDKDNNKSQEELYENIINNKIMDFSINYSKNDNTKKIKDRNNLFVNNYSPNLETEEFENRAKTAKNENKKDLSEYFEKFVNEIKLKNNQDLFSNRTLMKDILNSSLNLPTYILSFYQNDFLDIIPFVEQLIKDLINNIRLLPNSIKLICKIISILVRKKFKDIRKCDENAFISKFLLEKLLIPIISFPSFNGLISDFVISGNTIKNIKVVTFILKKLFSGNLFKNNSNECHYTPFNWLFINKMDNILHFFEKTKNVTLPNFIEKFVEGKLPPDYLYNYFDENKEQVYASISICFSIKNLINILDGLDKSKDFLKSDNPKIIKILRAFERLNDQDAREHIKSVDKKLIETYKEDFKKKGKSKDKNHSPEIENYYLYNNQEIEKKYEHLFSINNKIPNFYIDIKKQEKSQKLDEKVKNLIKIKNYLCSSLSNYKVLDKSEFNMEESNDTKKILEVIKTYMTLPNFILNNNMIPSIWYINSILEYLDKIPEEYKKDEYKKLFNELTENLNDAIKMLDLEILILFRNKLKFLNKIRDYYNNKNNLMNNIILNEKIKHFVEEASIPIDMYYKFDEKEKKFDLTKSNIKEKQFEDRVIYDYPKKYRKTLKTIEAFTTYFPNLTKYQLMQGINPIKIIKDLSINKKLFNYFEIIKERLKNDVFKNEITRSEYNIYAEKIKEYIMNKIYEKVYPPEPDEKDSLIFQKSIKLSWLELNYFLKKDYIYDIMLPDILNEFKLMNEVKTPYKKFNCIKNIMDYINSLIKFNEGLDKENIGAEDTTPLLNYIFIKAHPFKIFTDLEFIKTFSSDEGESNYYLKQFESMYNLLLNYTPKSFDLTREEYNNKCLEAINDNKKTFAEYNI